jgi:hypothetical protein
MFQILLKMQEYFAADIWKFENHRTIWEFGKLKLGGFGNLEI